MICRSIWSGTCNIVRSVQILSRIRIERRSNGQYSTNTNQIPFDDSQVKMVLQVLNECTVSDLKKFQIATAKCEKLVYFRTVNGAFGNLKDVLKIHGMGLKSLIEIFDCILSGDKASAKKTRKKQRQWITPSLLESKRQNVNTVVGLHVANHVVSWSKFTRDNHLVNWDLVNFPEQLKKPHPISVFQLAMEVLQKIPKADLYIMEDLLNSRPLTSNKASAHLANVQLWQFRAMLHMGLNTRNQLLNEEGSMHKVYFLHPHLAAQLFNTLIGTEIISLEKTVENILDQNCGLPDQSSPIFVNEVLCNSYFTKTCFDKENMGHALLLTVAFLNLVLHKNHESMKYIDGKAY